MSARNLFSYVSGRPIAIGSVQQIYGARGPMRIVAIDLPVYFEVGHSLWGWVPAISGGCVVPGESLEVWIDSEAENLLVYIETPQQPAAGGRVEFLRLVTDEEIEKLRKGGK